jgi:hypothetical protein
LLVIARIRPLMTSQVRMGYFLSGCLCVGSMHKKIADKFHQQMKLQISSLNWCTSCQICSPFAKSHLPKKAFHLVRSIKFQNNVGAVDPCQDLLKVIYCRHNIHCTITFKTWHPLWTDPYLQRLFIFNYIS